MMDDLVEELSLSLKDGSTFGNDIYEEIMKSLNIPKLLMYSSHDSQIGPGWEFLNPYEFWYEYIPFSSYI